jgi:phosphatidate phosphatase APP1
LKIQYEYKCFVESVLRIEAIISVVSKIDDTVEVQFFERTLRKKGEEMLRASLPLKSILSTSFSIRTLFDVLL